MKLFCLFVSFSLLIGEGWSVPECPDFSSSVCRLDLDNVLSIRNYEDSDAGNADNRCQFDCRQEPGCRNFTFFSPTVPGLRSTCLLFKSCKTSSFCASCVSGPPEPPLDTCGVKILLNSILLDLSHEEYNPGAIRKVAELARQPKQLEDNSEIESSGDGEVLTEGSGEENSNGSGSNEEDMSANEAESGDIENMVDKEDGENFSGKELDEDMSAKEDEQVMADKEEEEVMADKRR
ncbi:unnamed protein product [Lepeophtheirus salmonis]|uniref:(salmon louse) hypothetical protein n=1 Tax=Lepeophtheirus salmonis TaxID=72036 RepID=A0A7R8HCJ5_LEPSM|nr:unnamed protein product [Lepeophtheirus salmonis]CAF3017185.1 unnamed protein product [Lepeophtheirus salmonis]